MNTQEFLESILPSEGVYLLAVATEKGFRHKAFTTIPGAVDFIQQCDGQGATVYHACAAYKRAPYKNEQGRFVSRTMENWRAAKAFWIDVDCGADKAAEGHGYATQKEGAKAVLEWCQKHDLPFPMLINSGRGVHAYWCLTEELTPEAWVPAANAMKAMMQADGLLADPTRTADFASVLRPVGSHNRKNPQNPLEVKLALAQKGPVITSEFIAKLEAEAVSVGGLGEAPAWMVGGDAIPESANTYNECMFADVVAEHCNQVRIMRETKGDVSYDHWRGVIGLITHCQEGIELAREWSEKRGETGHQNTDVDTRYNTWTSPPPTCEYFEKCNPSGCDNCPRRGKIKTPWVLGVKEPEKKEETVEVEHTDTEGNTKKVQYQIPPMPQGYGWSGGQMIRYFKDEDGALVPHPFCTVQFYLLRRLRDANGEFSFAARAHLPKGEVREFTIPGGLIGIGGNKLMEYLGTFEIMAGNANDSIKNMGCYLKDEVGRLMNTTDVMNTYSHFGWQKDYSFLIGTRLYTPDGNLTEVLVSGAAADYVKVFPEPTGSVESYAKKINSIYNREGMEPMQYMICSLWAAPLVTLCDSMYNGIPCVLSGTQSGKGKTTAALAALYAYGRPMPGMAFSGKEGATGNAQANFLGTLRNLPVLFDEVTNKNSRELSELCYSLSSGVEKMRMKASGGTVRIADRNEWRTHTALTGNTQITARLATNGDTEAEVMRIFEINVDALNIPKLDPMAVNSQVSAMEEDMGAAGDAFLRYVVTHRADVHDLIFQTYDDLRADADLMAQPRYRFYRNHMVCTLACAKIMKQLGVIEFDIPKLTTFALEAARLLFQRTQEANTLSAVDALGLMLNDLSPMIVQTATYEVKPTEPRYEVRNSQGIVGRAIRGTPTLKDPVYDNTLYLSATAVRNWCNENRVSIDYLASCLAAGGVLKERRARCSLGKNTNITTSQCRCWKIDLAAMDNMKDN